MKRMLAIGLLAISLSIPLSQTSRAGDVSFPGAVPSPTPNCTENCTSASVSPTTAGSEDNGLTELTTAIVWALTSLLP